MGTQTPAAADLHRCRAHHPQAAGACGSASPPLALRHSDHWRLHPAPRPGARLTSTNRTYGQEGNHQGPWHPAYPARQPGPQA